MFTCQTIALAGSFDEQKRKATPIDSASSIRHYAPKAVMTSSRLITQAAGSEIMTVEEELRDTSSLLCDSYIIHLHEAADVSSMCDAARHSHM